MNPSSPPAAAPSPVTSAALRLIRRWHFYAGLICLPFLALMAITGALYLFHSEIDDLIYRDLRFVPGQPKAALGATQLVERASAAVGGVALRYTAPAEPGRSAEVALRGDDGRTWAVYLDPASGRLLGRLDEARKLMPVIKSLHSLAIAGTAARLWTEVVAGWAILLVISGLYLWWPRGASASVFSLRGRPGQRLWWRDLHALTGLLGGSVVLFLALTGMPWSAFWGQQLNTTATRWGLGMPSFMWDAVPQSTLPLADRVEVPWTLRPATQPRPGQPAELAVPGQATLTPRPIDLDSAVQAFEQMGLPPGCSIALPADAQGVYTAMCVPDDVHGQRVVHLDQYSGEPLSDLGYADYGGVSRVVEWGVAVHKGRQYGRINQLVMLAGCLAIVLLAISALTAWTKRRPLGQLGAPQRLAGDRLPRPLLAIAVVLGMVYPLLGASMLLALLGEICLPRLWRRRPAA